MKKVLFTAMLCLFAASTVMAEEVAKKPSFKGFVTNGFWDNWEISVGGGVATAITSGTNVGDRMDRIGWEVNGALTKWIHPVVGVRGQLMVGKFSNFEYGRSTEGYDPVKWGYYGGHADAMINFSNWVGGYRNDRVYYAVPFAGAGVIRAHASEDTEFFATVGLLNQFRVCKCLDINLELKALLTKTELAPANTMNGRFLGGMSATVGVSYRFNNRNFTRTKEYSAADLKVYQDAADASKAAADAAEAEKARLAAELKKAQAENAALKNAPKEVVRETAEIIDDAPVAAVVVYEIGTSTLNKKEQIRLDLLAGIIKDGDKNHVYHISGHADSHTGTAATNKRIADARAKGVYDYLVKCGVPAEQLTWEGRGDVDKALSTRPEASRVAIIKKVK